MSDRTVIEGHPEAAAAPTMVEEQLIEQLADQARSQGLSLTGEGGLLGRLTKMVVESALDGEMDDHLGYAKHDKAGRNGENSRNGTRAKTVTTEAGPVEIAVPRDREDSFQPQLVKKWQRRLSGVDGLVISLSAKGLSHGEISAHLAEVYGAEVSKQTSQPHRLTARPDNSPRSASSIGANSAETSVTTRSSRSGSAISCNTRPT